jgi:molecular chaperone GrpE
LTERGKTGYNLFAVEDKEKKDAKNPADRLRKCEEEKEEYLNGWKRTRADFINYKKEEAERFKTFAKLSNEALVSELIAVLDSFNLGLTVLSAEGSGNKSAEKGMRLIKSQLEDILKKYGLEKIVVKAGDVFNPSLHEALGETESQSPAGTIAEEVERGYTLAGKVIRPTRVNLAKGQHETNN